MYSQKYVSGSLALALWFFKEPFYLVDGLDALYGSFKY